MITNLYYTVLQKKENLSPRFYRAQMQLTKYFKLKIIHNPGKNLTVADMLSRTSTKEQLQIHQLRHKQLPPQMDFSIMKDNQRKPVHYLVKHEEIKCNQKNDCHPILADYGEDQFSFRINNKGEDIHIKPLDLFFFNPLFHLNLNTRSLQRTKQNHSYNSQLSLMTLILLVKKMNQMNHTI